MLADLQRVTTASLLPASHLAEISARTASLWAWQMTALMRGADVLRAGSAAAAETARGALPRSPSDAGSSSDGAVDLAAGEATAAAGSDLVASAVEKTAAAAGESEANLLDAVAAATAEAAGSAETAAADLAAAPVMPDMADLPARGPGMPAAGG